MNILSQPVILRRFVAPDENNLLIKASRQLPLYPIDNLLALPPISQIFPSIPGSFSTSTFDSQLNAQVDLKHFPPFAIATYGAFYREFERVFGTNLLPWQTALRDSLGSRLIQSAVFHSEHSNEGYEKKETQISVSDIEDYFEAPDETNKLIEHYNVEISPLIYLDPLDFVSAAQRGRINRYYTANIKFNLGTRNFIINYNINPKEELLAILMINEAFLRLQLENSIVYDSVQFEHLSKNIKWDQFTFDIEHLRRQIDSNTITDKADIKKALEEMYALYSPDKSPAVDIIEIEQAVQTLSAKFKKTWADIYYEAALANPISLPLSPDGNLPSELRPTVAADYFYQLFENNNIFTRPSDQELHEFLDKLNKISIKNILSQVNAKNSPAFDPTFYALLNDDITTVNLEDKDSTKSESISFAYSDLIIAPTNLNMRAQSLAFLSDANIAKEHFQKLLDEESLLSNPFIQQTLDDINNATSKMRDDDTKIAQLDPAIAFDIGLGIDALRDAIFNIPEFIRADTVQQEIALQEIQKAIAMKFNNMAVATFSYLLGHTDYANFTSHILVDMTFLLSKVKGQARYFLQSALIEIIHSIFELFGLESQFTEGNHPLKNIYDYLTPSKQLSFKENALKGFHFLDLILKELEGHPLPNPYLENVEHEWGRIVGYFKAKGDELSLEDDYVSGLANWPEYLDFIGLAKARSLTSLPALFSDFIGNKIDAPEFYSRIMFLKGSIPLDEFNRIFDDEFILLANNLEFQVSQKLSPDNQHKFKTRLRYALFLVQYIKKNKDIENEASKGQGLNEVKTLIRSKITEWIDTIDYGWPNPDASMDLWSEDSLVFKTDIDFEPDGHYYLLEEEFIDLWTDSDLPLQSKIAKLVFYFTSYDNGYYRYYCPIYFAESIHNIEISAYRDHTIYNRLRFILSQIVDIARSVLKEANLDQEVYSYCQNIIAMAELLAEEIDSFLKKQPMEPIWQIFQTDTKEVTSVMNQEIIPAPETRMNLSEAESSLLNVEKLLFDAQYHPWDFKNSTSFFASIRKNREISAWMKRSDSPHFQYYPQDLMLLSDAQLEVIVAKVRSLAASLYLDTKSMKKLELIASIIESLIPNTSTHKIDYYYVNKVMQLTASLNDIITDEQFYFRNKDVIDALISPNWAVPQNTANAEVILAFHIDLLDYLLAPLEAKTHYSDNLHQKENDKLIELYEYELSNVETPQLSEYFEVQLARADQYDALYLTGRLLQASFIGAEQAIARFNNVSAQLLTMSRSDLESLAGLSQYEPSSYAIEINRSWDKYERLWVPIYIRYLLSSTDRTISMPGNVEDATNEYARHAIYNINLAKLSDAQARKWASQYCTYFKIPFVDLTNPTSTILWHLDNNDEMLAAIPTLITEFFHASESEARRKNLIHAYVLFDDNLLDRGFNVYEQLYAMAILAQDLGLRSNSAMDIKELESKFREIATIYDSSFNSARVDDWLRLIRESEFHPAELNNLYHYIYNYNDSNYMMHAQEIITYVPELSHAEEPYDDKLDFFWQWMSCTFAARGNLTKLDLSKENIISDFDTAIATDLEDSFPGRTYLDTTNQAIISHTLKNIAHIYDNVSDPKLNRLAGIARFLDKALTEPYDVYDESEFKSHSRYNTRGQFTGFVSRNQLKKIFSIDHLLALVEKNWSSTADGQEYIRVYHQNRAQLKTLLASIMYFIDSVNNPLLIEDLVSSLHPTVEALNFILIAFDDMSAESRRLYEAKSDPMLKASIETIDEKLALIKLLLIDRKNEIETEALLQELVQIWAIDKSNYSGRDIRNFLIKPSKSISTSESNRSKQIIDLLAKRRSELVNSSLSLKTLENIDSRASLLQLLDFCLIKFSLYPDGQALLDQKSTGYFFDDLVDDVYSVFYNISQYSDNLSDFVRLVTEDLFYIENGHTFPNIRANIPLSLLSDYSTRDINVLCVYSQRLVQELDHLSLSPEGATENRVNDIKSLKEYFLLLAEGCQRVLSDRQETYHYIQSQIAP